jgi:hypothetical protein
MKRGTWAIVAAFLALTTRASAQVENLESRLEALTPSDPMAYFLLAEEVAYESPDAGDQRLAVHLFVLAHLLDKESGARLGLARSVALALADLESAPADRRWLLALAELLDSRVGAAQWEDVGTDGDDVMLRESVAIAFGLYMSGRYRDAEDLLEDPGVRDVADRYSRLLPGGMAPVDAALGGVPTCRECHNRRIVRSRTDPDGAPTLCYTCGGDPGPRLPDSAILQHLLVQSLLLDAVGDSWAADALTNRDEPLRAVDPAQLGVVYGVRVDRPWHRDGQWVESPDAPELDDSDD